MEDRILEKMRLRHRTEGTKKDGILRTVAERSHDKLFSGVVIKENCRNHVGCSSLESHVQKALDGVLQRIPIRPILRAQNVSFTIPTILCTSAQLYLYVCLHMNA